MGLFKNRYEDIQCRLNSYASELYELQRLVQTQGLELKEQWEQLKTLRKLLKYDSGYIPTRFDIIPIPYEPKSITIKDLRIELRNTEAHDTIEYVNIKKAKK